MKFKRLKKWIVFFVFCAPILSYATMAKGPFFWQVEKDDKISYILGTMHKGVSFEEIQCYEEVKDYLDTADILLREPQRHERTVEEQFTILEFTQAKRKLKKV